MKTALQFMALACLLLAGCTHAAAQSQTKTGASVDLTSISVEDLMNIHVTSVSKSDQALSKVAAAVFVIGAEDIRRSGATNIPDLLRMVPGLNVAQISASTWAIGARGLNGRFSNELLVLLDGRPVYTETFGGTYWDVLDTVLENIERIEIIRGPGGSMWGANAVDGVINIITKRASETSGGMIIAGDGTVHQGFGTAQYGGRLGSKTDYRVYGKYRNEGELPDASGQAGGDSWNILTGGFRVDTALSPKDELTIQANTYTERRELRAEVLQSIAARVPETINFTERSSGGYIRSIWKHTYSQQSGITLEGSFDTYKRDDLLQDSRRNVTAEFQYHIMKGDRNSITTGFAIRNSASTSLASFAYSLTPASLETQLFSAFLQDEITIVPNRISVTAGTKVQHSYYTGFVGLPSVRMVVQLARGQMMWTAISRAARTPSDGDVSVRLNLFAVDGPGGLPLLVAALGNRDIKNENVVAYELGYRASVLRDLSLDVALFYDRYTNQFTQEPLAPVFEANPQPPHLLIAAMGRNLMHGEGHGAEIAANVKVFSRWSLRPGYAFQAIHMHTSPSSLDTISPVAEQGSSPHNSIQLRSQVNLPRNFMWDTSVFYVAHVPAGNIPSYTRLDTQLSWSWGERASFYLVGQNLLTDHHLEFEEPTHSVLSTLAKRSAYAKVVWRF